MQLTHLEGDGSTALWSPDGKWIAMQQQAVRLQPSLSATADGKSITQYDRQSVIKPIEFAR